MQPVCTELVFLADGLDFDCNLYLGSVGHCAGYEGDEPL